MPPRTWPFRTAILNLVGWSALIGATLVSGAIAAAFVPRGEGYWAFVMAGALLPFAVAVVLDRLKWRNQSTSWTLAGDLELSQQVARNLAAAGIACEIADDLIIVTYRNAESRKINKALHAAGLVPRVSGL